jgi:hypothetical protein
MSIDLSRRQSLKLMTGLGLFSIIPMESVISHESSQVYVLVTEGFEGEVFYRSVSEAMEATNAVQIKQSKNYESLLALRNLTKGSLLIGLTSDAEKILVDAIVQNQRGSIETTAVVSTGRDQNKRLSVSSTADLKHLAEMTLQSALSESNDNKKIENFQNRITNRALTSFYAFL